MRDCKDKGLKWKKISGSEMAYEDGYSYEK